MSPGAGGSGDGLLLFLAASALVIGLTYGASRLLGQWQVNQGRGRRMRVLEGMPTGRDRSLLLVKVGKEVLVVGSSPSGFALLHQVTDPEDLMEMLAAGEASTMDLPQSEVFTALEASVRKNLSRIQELMARGRSSFDA